MGLFWNNKNKTAAKTYDAANLRPVLKSSICTGEQVAGFENIHTGVFQDVKLIKTPADLEEFKKSYGIEGDLKKIY